MAWEISGQWINVCSCKVVCPCIFGPAEPDQGWCSGADIIQIERGSSDGVDLGGARAAMATDLPGDFVSGNGTARLYLDEGASAEQRRELEAIFTGKKGGIWEAFAAGMTSWQSVQVTRIEVEQGETTTVTIGGAGRLQVAPITTEDGRQAIVENAPLMAAFGVERAGLARGDGTAWSDGEMRRWESGGSAFTIPFTWSA